MLYLWQEREVNMVEKEMSFCSVIRQAQILGVFHQFVELNSSVSAKARLRNILAFTSNIVFTIQQIFEKQYSFPLSEEEALWVSCLIKAFLTKSTFRKRVDEITRKSLFLKQDCKCAICGKNIDVSSTIDHIIPFKYVGDELANNLQMLCKSCNDKKNASLDYQIRFLLKLV